LISEDKADAPEQAEGPRTAPPAGPGASSPRRLSSGPVETAAGHGRLSASSSAKAGRIEGTRHWPAALASGDWDAILTDADRTGVKTILESASGEELFALADAARYRRRLDLAREALLAERRRFPGSARAPDALFLLGRVEEAGGQGSLRALHWYEDYLARAPSGTYASEALGRRMTLTSELEGPARARPIADEYLRRFPDGSYAGAARALRH
jgi:TolA-binding protein